VLVVIETTLGSTFCAISASDDRLITGAAAAREAALSLSLPLIAAPMTPPTRPAPSSSTSATAAAAIQRPTRLGRCGPGACCQG
jgi:hypothetical protein